MFIAKRDEQQLYTRSQYRSLMNITIAASAISVFFSILTLLTFFYVRSRSSNKASKLSLRCVFIATIMNIITAAFNILTIIQRGDGVLCRSSTIIKLASNASSASLLAIIGVNLVFLFVINAKKTKKLERILYTSVFIFVMLTISVPIYEVATTPLEPDGPFQCWYYVHFSEAFGHSDFLWMWFYGFLFVSIFVAFISLLIVLIKLLREHNSVIGRFTKIAATSESPESANLHLKYRKKKQSSIFIKVVSRCSLYPLVPLICNLSGFISQLILVNPNANSDFVLSATDTVLSSLQGFFLTIIFFTDPAVISFFRDRWDTWKNRYLYEFQEIQTYENGHIQVYDKKEIRFTVTTDTNDTLEPLPYIFQSDGQPRSTSSSLTLLGSPLIPFHYNNQRDSLRRKSSVTLPSPVRVSQNYAWEPHKKECEELSSPLLVPMRRVSVSPSVYTRMTQRSFSPFIHQDNLDNHAHLSNFDYIPHGSYPESSYSQSTLQRCLPDPNIPNIILVPYKHPRFAKFVHWVLFHFGVKKPDIRLEESTSFPESSLPVHPLDI